MSVVTPVEKSYMIIPTATALVERSAIAESPFIFELSLSLRMKNAAIITMGTDSSSA